MLLYRITACFLALFISLDAVTSAFKLAVHNKETDKMEEKELSEYIENGKIMMLGNSLKCKIAKKGVMVLGLSGTGKTTLINYLNGIPLVGKKIGRKFIVDLQYENRTLPCGFEIGHSVQAMTSLPSAYTPPGCDYSYLDNPGFKDTRGLEYEIANTAFRKQITENIDEFKFLLVISEKGVSSRGQQFRDSMKRFSDFLGIFDTKNAEILSESIGIIVTKVRNDGDTDRVVTEYLKEDILKIIEDENRMKENNKQLCGTDDICRHRIENIDLVFRRVLENNQIGIFSSPVREGILDDEQKNQIIALVERLNYVKKNDGNKQLDFRVIVGNRIQELHSYASRQFKQFNQFTNEIIEKIIVEHYSNKMKAIVRDISDGVLIFKQLHEIRDHRSMNCELDAFIGMNGNQEQICATGTFDFGQLAYPFSQLRQQLLNKESIVIFLDSLLPYSNRHEFSFNKKWLENDGLQRNITKLINEQEHHVKTKYELFRVYFQNVLAVSLDDFYEREILRANTTDDIKSIKNILDGLSSKIENNNNNDISLINQMKSTTILKEKEAFEILNKTKLFDIQPFTYKIDLMDSHYRDKLAKKLKVFDNQLTEYYKGVNATSEIVDGIFTSKEYFGKISTIMHTINNNASIENLKTVRIFSAYSLTFDEDFAIIKQRYEWDAPHLQIISPRVFVDKNVKVDLSCLHSQNPTYNAVKAADGSQPGEPGENGKDGLRGCNGGSLLIISGDMTNQRSLTFISNGRQGGDGQDGGNGKNGKHAELTSITSSEVIDEMKNGQPFSISGVEGWFTQSGTKYKLINNCVGDNGQKGGRGGDGGKGGCGGAHGAKLIVRYPNTEIKERESKLLVEKSGRGGEAGSGSQTGDKRVCEVWSVRTWVIGLTSFWSSNSEEEFNYLSQSEETAESGKKYENMDCSELPEQNIPKLHNNFLYEIETQYLKFIRDKKCNLRQQFTHQLISLRGKTYSASINDLVERVQIFLSHESECGDDKIEILSSMLDEVNAYSTKNENELFVVNMTRAAVLSTINRHNATQETNMIVDLKAFLELSVTISDDWTSLTKEMERTAIKQVYTGSIKEKEKKAIDSLIELRKDIDANQDEMGKNIANVLSEIENMMADAENYEASLLKQKKKLESALAREKVFGVLKVSLTVIGLAVSCAFPPLAPAALAAAGAAGTYAELVEQGIDQFGNKYKRAKRNSKNETELSRKVENTKTKFEKAGKVANVGLDILKSQKDLNAREQTIKHVEEAIQNNRQQMNSLNETEEGLSKMQNELKALYLTLSTNSKDQIGKSTVELRVSKYQMKRIIDDFRSALSRLVQISESRGSLDTTIKRLEDAITTINDVFGEIEKYRDDIKLANYIADMGKSENFFNITEHRNEVLSLKEKIISNEIAQKYEQSLKAFSQWSFPFFCSYLTKNNQLETAHTITAMKNNLKKLLEIVKEEESTYKPKYDDYTILFKKDYSFYRWSSKEYSFEIERLLRGEEVTLYANINEAKHDALRFNTLSILIEAQTSKEDNKTLNELLGHYSVQLTCRGRSDFRFKNEIYSLRSFYNRGSELKLLFSYGCEQKCDVMNKSYKKLSEMNSPVLSPFTLWNMKIVPRKSADENINKERLEMMGILFQRNQVDVSLFGKGQYVSDEYKKHVDSCNGEPRPNII